MCARTLPKLPMLPAAPVPGINPNGGPRRMMDSASVRNWKHRTEAWLALPSLNWTSTSPLTGRSGAFTAPASG